MCVLGLVVTFLDFKEHTLIFLASNLHPCKKLHGWHQILQESGILGGKTAKFLSKTRSTSFESYIIYYRYKERPRFVVLILWRALECECILKLLWFVCFVLFVLVWSTLEGFQVPYYLKHDHASSSGSNTKSPCWAEKATKFDAAPCWSLVEKTWKW